MGLFGLDSDRLFDPLDIGGDRARDAAEDAAQIQFEQFQKGLAELQRQFGISQGNISPFVQAGQGQLPFLEQGASVEGLDQILGDIMNTDMFGELVDERRLGVEGMLGAGGLTRSGAAIEEGARIPTDLAMEISNILNGRASTLAAGGQNAAVGAGQLSGQFGGQQSGLFGQQGNALAGGILGGQQAQAQGTQNALALASMFFNKGK